MPDDWDSSGTDSDTASSFGDTDLLLDLEIQSLEGDPAQQDVQIYWQYQKHKRIWRRHMNKPTRRVRRFVRRTKGKGKRSARGRGKHRFHFLDELPDEDHDLVFFGGNGKGKRRSSSKGKGRRQRPKAKAISDFSDFRFFD